MSPKIIPNIVCDQTIHQLPSTANVFDATRIMTENKIAAIVVTNGDGSIVGIFTERDVTRTVAQGRDPAATKLEEVMTANPDTLGPDDQPMDALELMLARKYRHLPVSKDGRAVGMVSCRDLYKIVKATLEDDIKQKEAFIFGENYGASQ